MVFRASRHVNTIFACNLAMSDWLVLFTAEGTTSDDRQSKQHTETKSSSLSASSKEQSVGFLCTIYTYYQHH